MSIVKFFTRTAIAVVAAFGLLACDDTFLVQAAGVDAMPLVQIRLVGSMSRPWLKTYILSNKTGQPMRVALRTNSEEVEICWLLLLSEQCLSGKTLVFERFSADKYLEVRRRNFLASSNGEFGIKVEFYLILKDGEIPLSVKEIP